MLIFLFFAAWKRCKRRTTVLRGIAKYAISLHSLQNIHAREGTIGEDNRAGEQDNIILDIKCDRTNNVM